MTFRFLAPVSLCLAALPALAEPATEAGAARIESALQVYLGSAEGAVIVLPEGETYALTLDAMPLLALGRAAGVTGAISPLHYTLTDQGDGKWGVAQDEPVAMRLRIPGALDLDVSTAATRWQGVFDTTLMAFSEGEATIEDMRVDEVLHEAPDLVSKVTYHVAQASMMTSAQGNPGGGVDSTVSAVLTGLTESMAFTSGTGAQDMDADFTADLYRIETKAVGVRTAEIYALAAWFVAHPSEDAIEANFAGLTGALRGALPLWERMGFEGVLENVAVSTPAGSGGADRAEVAVEMSGFVQDGRLRETVRVEGLRLPEELLPDWVPPLLPKDVAFDFAVSGFDMATAAATFLDALGPDIDPGPEFGAKLLEALLPEGKVTITLAPQGARSNLYALDLEGTFDAGPERMPEGKIAIGAEGIEAVLVALNAAPEDVRSGAVPGLMMLRGISKPAGVGRYVWEIDMTPEGKVLVNGLDMSAFGGKP